MKKYIIVILLLNCVISYCSSIYQNKIFGAMASLGIDSVRVHFFHPLNLSELTITVKKNKEASFILDSLKRKEIDRKDVNDDIPDDLEFVYYPAKLSIDDEDFLLSCINVFFISKTGKIFKLRRKEKFCIESDDDCLSITCFKGKKKEKLSLVLCDVYDPNPTSASDETHQYSREFMYFMQMIIFITSEQGPYSERYERAIERMAADPNYIVYDFSKCQQ
jgi:hypothetical protein